MYIYFLNNKVFWGRHQRLPCSSYITWVFRRKCLKFGHPVISGDYNVVMEKGGVIVSQKGHKSVFISRRAEYCYYIKNGEIRDTDTKYHHVARNQFRQMFLKRLLKYNLCYLVPIEKNVSLATYERLGRI